MTVATYLKRISDGAIIRDSEKESIRKSIATIQARLDNFFGSAINEKFIFGSYTRGTILPRSMDDRSDIDYMIVFENDGVKPQSYLDRLKKFAERYYSSSEMKQSHPTIKLNLNHITFELVPAQKTWFSGYRIPSKKYGIDDWIDTNPNDFNQALTDKNKQYGYLIKPLIRLMKYWNAKNGYIFESFSLEKWIVEQYFSGATIFHTPDLKECLFQCFDKLGTGNLSETDKYKVNRAKSIVEEVRKLEKDGYPVTAEGKIKKLIPDTDEGSKGLAAALLGLKKDTESRWP